jgi:hypothetical protein
MALEKSDGEAQYFLRHSPSTRDKTCQGLREGHPNTRAWNTVYGTNFETHFRVLGRST